MPEEINALGRVEVDESTFAPEYQNGEAADTETVVEGEEAGGTEEVVEGGETVVEEGKEGAEVVEPEKEGGEQEEEGRVYANKYHSVEELKKAFVNLGGNPNKYSTPEALEEAYEVRQAEWRRITNEQSELARLSKVVTEPTPGRGDNPQAEVEALLDKVDWAKVENARDLGRALVGILREGQPQQRVPSEAEIVDRVLPVLQQREAAQRELSELESEIPNLRYVEGQENEFRNAFATFILGEKRSGNYQNLRTSMKNFLRWNETILEQAGKMKAAQQEAKQDAGSISERGAGLPPSGSDEVESIIGSYKSRQEKFGGLAG